MSWFQLILVISGLAGLPTLWAQEAWVRQTDLATGQIYDTPVIGTGGAYTAPVRVNETGSLYQLFARGTAWDTNIYLLDTKIIGAYNPLATLSITSEDSYVRGDLAAGTYVRRTRADRPFSIDLHVSGLVNGSASTAERSVYFAVHGRNYDPLTYSALDQPRYLQHECNVENGDVHLGPAYHELTSPTMSTGCGEQCYTIVRYAGYQVPDTILVEPTIEIWPVPTAAVTTVTSAKVFIDRIPTVVLTLKHLYPDSRTYAQIYAGRAALGTVGTVIEGTERRYGRHYNPDQVDEPTNVPQDVAISMEDLSTYAAADGAYTLEVITETPFFNRAPERLLSVTFEVDRVISSRGQLSTAEKTSP
ncbi:MAG: hypothetical protein JWO08_717 [Verrucomicrobiaceae bacterium]|nr:hypothetical protein [Verrucomicrobiaceae bacterium]